MRKINNLTGGVYSITSKDGKILYIGASSDIEKSYLSHYGRLNNGNHENSLLQDFCDHYGFNNLNFKTICMCEEYELMYFEKLLINILNPVCNKADYIIKKKYNKNPYKKEKKIKEKDDELKVIDDYLQNNKIKTYKFVSLIGNYSYDYYKSSDIIKEIKEKYNIDVTAKKLSMPLREIGYIAKQLKTGERVWIKK